MAPPGPSAYDFAEDRGGPVDDLSIFRLVFFLLAPSSFPPPVREKDPPLFPPGSDDLFRTGDPPAF